MKRWVASLATLAAPTMARSSAHPSSATTLLPVITDNHHRHQHHDSMMIIQSNRIIRKFGTENDVSGSTARSLHTRGGGNDEGATKEVKYVTLSEPAPGTPFHIAFPVHDLAVAKEFYGTILGCQEGRSSEKWQDYSLHGHQIVCHWVGNDYRCQDYYNPVDGDEVPVPHFGLALTVEQFHALADRLRKAGIKFIIEPHLRFEGMPGEQVRFFIVSGTS